MSSTYCTLYVLRLVPPGHFYVGTTTQFAKRLDDHKRGLGATWTTRHGVHSVVEHYEVPLRDASRLEDEKTIEMMRAHGWQGVRGGNFNNCRPGELWWLPDEFRPAHVNGYGLYQ